MIPIYVISFYIYKFILIEGLARETKFVRLNQLFSVELDAELSDESLKSTHVRLYRQYSCRKIN